MNSNSQPKTHEPTSVVRDKKAQKKIEVLRQKLTKLKQQLAGARGQMDDPDEVTRLESEIASAEAEIEKWKAT